MAYTQAQLEALQAALASGELRVSFEGRSVEYRSIEELTKAIAVISGQLASSTGRKPVRQVRVFTDKGF